LTANPQDAASATATRILEAATNQFFAFGYHGASMKQLAQEAGIRSATLYYHFPNKQQLLVDIMRTTLESLTASVQVSIEAETDPVRALSKALTSHILFHVDHHREVFLCDAELRALVPDARPEIVALRDRYEEIFRSTLRAGRDTGVLAVPSVELVSRSLLASCSGIAVWFRPDGDMTIDEVAATYVNLFLGALRP